MIVDTGLLYVVAASLPILAGLLLFILQRRCTPWAGWLAAMSMGVSLILAIVGMALYLQHIQTSRDQLQQVLPWTGSFTWLHLSYLDYAGNGNLGFHVDAPGNELRLGYQVDTLTTILFLLILFIASCIALYANRSLRPASRVWYFTLFSFFTGVLLHLILADNLVQVFICWELLGLCSYFLIGYSHQHSDAQPEALKSFLMKRVGSVGFLVALAVLWTYTGTLSLVTVREEVRDVLGNVVLEEGVPKRRIDQISVLDAVLTPSKDTHDDAFTEKGAEAGMLCRVEPIRSGTGRKKLELSDSGSLIVVWDQETLNGHYHKPDRRRFDAFDAHRKGAHGKGLKTMPYWALVVAGLGLLLGVVGMSAQFPLQTWLPVAIAGPTPTNTLVHLTGMAVTGVYLLARVFPLLTPEVLMTVAYLGMFTAFYAATCALPQQDVKKLLAYITMSQIGLMLAAVGVGGWSMALFHLATFVCSMTLLFLGTGITRRTPMASGCILFACLALAGMPLLPCWYSMTGILAAICSFCSLNTTHLTLLILALFTAAMTAANLVRYWRLIFTDSSSEQAVDSRGFVVWSMLALAIFSLAIAWLPHPLAMEKNWLARGISMSEPTSVRDEGTLQLGSASEQLANGYFKSESWLRPVFERTSLGPQGLAIILLLISILLGGAWVWRRSSTASKASPFLTAGWYWDNVLQRLIVKPTMLAARGLLILDRKLWDGIVRQCVIFALFLSRIENRFDDFMIDGLVRQSAKWTQSLRKAKTVNVLQTAAHSP